MKKSTILILIILISILALIMLFNFSKNLPESKSIKENPSLSAKSSEENSQVTIPEKISFSPEVIEIPENTSENSSIEEFSLPQPPALPEINDSDLNES